MELIHLKKLIKGEYSVADVIDYFRANIRYVFYYNKYLKLLLPLHITEQIDFRINQMMDKQCLTSGSCKECGCQTTHLQMANKACEGRCYPKMVTKNQWTFFKERGFIIEKDCMMWKHKSYNQLVLKENVEIKII